MAFVTSIRANASTRNRRACTSCSLRSEDGGRRSRTEMSRRVVLMTGALALTAPFLAIAEEEENEIWRGPLTLGYSFRYPKGWTATKKQIKTHVSEVNVKKEGSSASAGLVVDPVKISKLQDFGTPDQVAEKVLGVEKKKDGVIMTKTTSATESKKDGLTYYTIEYEVENSRGHKQYIACLTVNDLNLYVLTVQAKAAEFDALRGDFRTMLDSFYVKPSFNNM